MSQCEDSYGTEKRFRFICEAIDAAAPKTILDMGCGVGHVVFPLANRYPEIRFFGIDSDYASIEYARSHHLADNLTFGLDEGESGPGAYDMVIASEVIEHVESPAEFLSSLRQKLTKNGQLILTLPNGYGPFEMASLGLAILRLAGVYGLLRRTKHFLAPRKTEVEIEPVTLAVSPHINFFSYNAITGLLSESGFAVDRYLPRTFLCGFGFDHLMRDRRLLDWNAGVSNSLPAFASSGWMFLARPSEKHVRASNYRRGIFGRFRRYLNEKQAGIG